MLLRGEATMFGKPVRLQWPDGLPNGITEDGLKEIGRGWAP
jgi:hypothetical protein